MTPARKLTHNMKFECFLDAERHEFWEHHNYSSPLARESPKSNPERHKFWEHHNCSSPWARELPKSNPERHDFGNTIILRYPGPENCQNQTQKDTNFEKMHSLTPAKNANK